MNKLLLAAFIFSAGPAAALEGEKITPSGAETAAPAAQKKPEPGPLKYSSEIRLAVKNLALLLERGAEIPPARLDALAPELAGFNAKLAAALGRDLLADAARRERELEDAERAAAAKKALQDLRSALQVYYADNNGKYPADVSELAPQWLPAVPELRLPGHEKTARVTVIDSRKYDKDFSAAVTDSGGWLYFSGRDSLNYGLLVIDCRHPDRDGAEFFKY